MVRNDFKSDIEYYFWLYCEELKEAGFIEEVEYEVSTYGLCSPYLREYLYKGKKKTIVKTESILQKSSITADFTIKWTKKAENIFYLNPKIPINYSAKNIPFRLSKEDDSLISLIETKGMSESKTSSSISFPLKQKQLVKDRGIYIQKIKPYWPRGKNCLFEQTFTPRAVLKKEIYKRDCKYGNKGELKIKYKVLTLNDYLLNLNTRK